MAGGRAAIEGLQQFDRLKVYDLQSLHRRL
jgi:hypothetical protein